MQLLLATIPMLGYGVIDAITVGTAKRVPALYFILLQNFITLSCFVLVIILFVPTRLFSDPAAWFALCGGFFLVLGYLAFLKALAVGKAGVVTAFAHGYILVAALIGILFLGESANSVRILAILVVLAGLTILSTNLRDLRSITFFSKDSGLLFALLSMFGWGIGFSLQKIASDALPLFEAAVLVELGAFIVPTSVFLLTQKPLAKYRTFRWLDLGIIAIVAVGFFGLQTALITAFSLFDLGLVATIAGSSSIITAILSYFLYRQTLSGREMIGILVVVFGLGLLGWHSV